MKLLPYIIAVLIFALPFQGLSQTNDVTVSPSKPLISNPKTIVTLAGKRYDDCTIIKTELDGITVIDSDGGGKIFFTDMSPELQKQFGYDPIKAKQYTDSLASADKKAEIQRQQYQAANKTNQLKAEQDKLNTLKQAMDTVSQEMDAMSHHTNEFGVVVSNNPESMPPALKQLQQEYINDKAAYDVQVKVVQNLQH